VENPITVTASASSSSAAGRPEAPAGAAGRRLPLGHPPLVAAWLAGADRELLAPLRFALPGDPLPTPRREAVPERLARALERANRSYGHTRAGELVARLEDPATAVVVAGQQPGLFGGPLYTLLKALAAARWAALLEAAGQPAIALFWVATEDHDWEEVAKGSVWGHGGLRRLGLGPDSEPLAPVGMRPLGVAVEALLDELETYFPRPTQRQFLERLRSWYRPEARFGEAFCRLLVGLLGERAPLLVDAMLPELKSAQAPWLGRLVERRREVVVALEEAEESITRRGYPLQVSPQPGAAPLFLFQGRERRRVLWVGSDRFSLRGAEDGGSPVRDLSAILEENPSAVSPNVLSRPVLQDAVLGTTLQVMGPGEISYLAQAAPLYRLLEVPAPAVALRPQALLLEEAQLRLLDELELPLEALLEDEDALDRRLAARQGADVVAPAAAAIDSLIQELRQPAIAVDPSLERPWEKTRDTVSGALERFGDKVARAAAGRDQTTRRRLEALTEYCRPGGVIHERVFCLAHFRGRHGAPLVDALWEQLSLEPGELQVLEMPEAPE
jgi:bacillithiol synthase